MGREVSQPIATPTLTRYFTVVAVIVVLIYSARYLPESPALFTTIFLVRAVFSLVLGLALAAAYWIVRRLFGRKSSWLEFFRLALMLGAVVATLMVIISLGTPYPEELVNAYLGTFE
jgi:4-amino-4-deoxy-L-arabinose transferase-like glycosyltransferase